MKRPMAIAICWWWAPVLPGLMAALTAARTGARVILADESSALGGSLLNENEEIGGVSGLGWAVATIAELSSMPNVTLMPRTTIFGWYDDNIFGAVERVNDHVLEAIALRAAAALLAHHGQTRGDGHGSGRTPHRVRRQ